MEMCSVQSSGWVQEHEIVTHIPGHSFSGSHIPQILTTNRIGILSASMSLKKLFHAQTIMISVPRCGYVRYTLADGNANPRLKKSFREACPYWSFTVRIFLALSFSVSVASPVPRAPFLFGIHDTWAKCVFIIGLAPPPLLWQQQEWSSFVCGMEGLLPTLLGSGRVSGRWVFRVADSQGERVLPPLPAEGSPNSEWGVLWVCSSGGHSHPGEAVRPKQIRSLGLWTPGLQSAIYLSQIGNCIIFGCELDSWRWHILLSVCHRSWHPWAGRNLEILQTDLTEVDSSRSQSGGQPRN